MQQSPVTAGAPSSGCHSAGTSDIAPDTNPVLPKSHTRVQPEKLGSLSCSECEKCESRWSLLAS
jgi:hypothetical protein